MKYILTILFSLVTILAIANIAEENVNPDINRNYQGAKYKDWVNVFEREGREVFDKRHEVVSALKLHAGMNIADIGAGTGFYSLLFAKEVGKIGNVYAVDITDDFILNINRRAREQNLPNIHAVLSNQKDTLLAPNSIDIAFVCDTYHHFEYPQTMLASIYRALRTGGKLVIIDFRKEDGVSSSWVMSHVRSGKKEVTKEVEQAKFKFLSETNILESNYFLWFTKSE